MPVCKEGFDWIEEMFGFARDLRGILNAWKNSNPRAALDAHTKLGKKRLSTKQARTRKFMQANAARIVESEFSWLSGGDDHMHESVDSDDLLDENSLLLD